MINKTLYDLINKWLDDTGNYKRINVGVRLSHADNKLTIYTDGPGPLIGPQGARVEKFRQLISEALHMKDLQVDIVEFDGFVTNAGAVKKVVEEQLKKARLPWPPDNAAEFFGVG